MRKLRYCLVGLLPLVLFAACHSQPEWRRRAALLRDPGFPRPPRGAPRCLTDETLAAGLRAAVRSAQFAAVWDYGPLYGQGCPAEQSPACLSLVGPLGRERHPQLDLSVVVHNRAGCVPAVAKATVLYDRAHPEGLVGQHDPKTLELQNVRFRKWDEARFNGGRWQLEAAGQEARIAPGTEVAFSAPYPPDSLLGPDRESAAAVDFMSPWPASVFKLMVATRFLQLLDEARTADGQPIDLETPIELPPHELVSACPAAPQSLSLRHALETMLQWSGHCSAAGLVKVSDGRASRVSHGDTAGTGSCPAPSPTPAAAAVAGYRGADLTALARPAGGKEC